MRSRLIRILNIIISFCLGVVWLSGCSYPAPASPTSLPTSGESSATAIPATPTEGAKSIMAEPEAYPAPTKDPNQPPEVTPFNLDKPLLAGATQITGVGRPGVPIMLVDITFMGVVLGQGTIQDDGTFSIKVAALEKGHRIGIALANLDGTGLSEKDFRHRGYFGDLALTVPQVGFFYDTAQVK
jgi:hypothetical protein